jgi:uncharacterized protein
VRIVLDTNVLVSGLLNPFGPPGRIVQMAAAGELSLCYDARILCEYRGVLSRPAFGFRLDHVDSLLEQFRAVGELVATVPLAHHLPDQDDEPFLEVAVAATAEYLVTGNIRHYPAAARCGVRVVSPAAFVEAFQAKQRQ